MSDSQRFILPCKNHHQSYNVDLQFFSFPHCRFLGSSGQNINDIFRYTSETDSQARLDAACRTLDWGHIAPTAPDTLCEYKRCEKEKKSDTKLCFTILILVFFFALVKSVLPAE